MPFDSNGTYVMPQMTGASFASLASGTGDGASAGIGSGMNGVSGGNFYNVEAAQPNTFQNIGTGIQGLSNLFGIYQGIQGLSLARDQYKLSRDAYKTNLANSASAYNTNLSDMINGRAATSDMSQEERDRLIAERSVSGTAGV